MDSKRGHCTGAMLAVLGREGAEEALQVPGCSQSRGSAHLELPARASELSSAQISLAVGPWNTFTSVRCAYT